MVVYTIYILIIIYSFIITLFRLCWKTKSEIYLLNIPLFLPQKLQDNSDKNKINVVENICLKLFAFDFRSLLFC